MKKIVMMICLMLSLVILAGCDSEPEETGNGNTDINVDDSTANEVTDATPDDTNETEVTDTTEVITENKDLPDLYNEEVYFKVIEEYYQAENDNDPDMYRSLRYYTDDTDGKLAFLDDERRTSESMGLDNIFIRVSGMKVFIEPDLVEEGDADNKKMTYRVKIILIKEKINLDENGEFKAYENNAELLDSISHISTVTLGYDEEALQWKVWNAGDLAIFRIFGIDNDDWYKYVGASDDQGGFIGEYGQWYSEQFPPAER